MPSNNQPETDLAKIKEIYRSQLPQPGEVSQRRQKLQKAHDKVKNALTLDRGIKNDRNTRPS